MDYSASQDLGRVEMDVWHTSPMEQLTMTLLDIIENRAVLHIGRKNTQVSVPIAVNSDSTQASALPGQRRAPATAARKRSASTKPRARAYQI